MKNIIEKILKNKALRIIIPAVLVAAIIVVVLQLTFRGGSKTEWNNYFENTDYPVTLAAEKDGLHIRLDGSKSPGLGWEISAKNDYAAVEKAGKEKDDKLEILVKPEKSGYASINCRRSGTIGDLAYTAVSLELSVLIQGSNGKLTATLSDIYQESSNVGALDTDTPYLIEGMRIIFPNGGNWEIVPENEAEMPEGLYDVMMTVNDAGYDCAVIMYNLTDKIMADEALMEKASRSRLVFRNTDIDFEKYISCYMRDDGSWGIDVEDE